MANGNEHLDAGSVSGAVVAGGYAVYKEHNIGHIITYTLGGCLGGRFTACFADKIDVPTSPNHRNIAHSITFNASVACLGQDLVRTCLEYLNNKAEQYSKEMKPLYEFLYILLAGIIIGMLSGHVSHLLLDIKTPKSLPL